MSNPLGDAKETRRRTGENPAERAPKRTRTGCLTCRERHIKCDEVYPICSSCGKGNRQCQWGLRIRYDTPDVRRPQILVETEGDYHFKDESVSIASEYLGGVERYGQVNASDSSLDRDAPNPKQKKAPTKRTAVELDRSSPENVRPEGDKADSYSPISPIASDVELTLMRVFVEEMGAWMDTMNSIKYFSRVLPYESRKYPMLYNAFLACGACHLSHVNPEVWPKSVAEHYYAIAMNEMEDGERHGLQLLTISALVLDVYELMSPNKAKPMQDLRDSRALIQKCKWDGRSDGAGGACFWLHRGMELLRCLGIRSPVRWDPDQWNVEELMADFDAGHGTEYLWTHRIIYIVSKIANFAYRREKPDPRQALKEWEALMHMANDWERKKPKTMFPLGWVEASPNADSLFPKIWIPDSAAVLSKTFHLTGKILLAKSHPKATPDRELEMKDMRLRYARIMCGIARHLKDRSVASMVIQSSAVAAELLEDRREQDEMVTMFVNFEANTGWKLQKIVLFLKMQWGRQNELPITNTPSPASSSSLPELPRISALNQMISQQQRQLPQLLTARGEGADSEDLVTRIRALSSRTSKLMTRRTGEEDSDGG